MGQSPSASLSAAAEDVRGGDAVATRCEGERTMPVRGSVGDRFCVDLPCRCLVSCLPPPRCFLSLLEGRRRAAFVDVAEGAAKATTATQDEECPPDALALTDDENDDAEDTGGNDRDREGKADLPQFPADTDPSIPKEILSRIVAIDCGMVKLPRSGSHKYGGRIKRKSSGRARRALNTPSQALRRVCVVDGHGSPLLCALVRVGGFRDRHSHPPLFNEDVAWGRGRYKSAVGWYLSGLLPQPSRVTRTGDDLDLGIPAREVREEAHKLLRGKIVVGHSVEGDLAVLGLGRHSQMGGGSKRDFEVRDTAYYAPFMRKENRTGGQQSKKLRDLVRERLNREIQTRGEFHCCEEDAVAALDLYKSVYHEWEVSLGDALKEELISRESHRGEISDSHVGDSKTRRPNAPEERREVSKKSKQKKKPNIKSFTEQRSRRTLPKKKKRKNKGGGGLEKLLKVPTVSCCLRLVSSLHSVISFPVFLPARMMHDLVYLSQEMAAYAVWLARKQRGIAASHNKSHRSQMKHLKKKKSRLSIFRRHFCTKKVDSFFLLSHCLFAAHNMLMMLVQCSEEEKDAIYMHCANGVLAAGLIGVDLLLHKKRNGFEARILFAILAQSHIVSSIVRIYCGWQVARRLGARCALEDIGVSLSVTDSRVEGRARDVNYLSLHGKHNIGASPVLHCLPTADKKSSGSGTDLDLGVGINIEWLSWGITEFDVEEVTDTLCVDKSASFDNETANWYHLSGNNAGEWRGKHKRNTNKIGNENKLDLTTTCLAVNSSQGVDMTVAALSENGQLQLVAFDAALFGWFALRASKKL